MSKGSNDRALRIYNEVLGLDRLHYGIWDENDQLTYDNLKQAQIRYENFIIENIPNDVKTILDVGCGTGVLTKKLIELGYKAEGLSPDINQKKVFEENVNTKFHHCKFGHFNPPQTYDCLIMSESAQYIKINRLFDAALKSLTKSGYLLICDYFVLNNHESILHKSGHSYDLFKEKVNAYKFKILTENDLTDRVLKTLDIAEDFAQRALKGLDIGTERIRKKHPYLTKFTLWLFRKKILKIKEQMQLLDSDLFKKHKTYRFFLLQST
jgi:SAM-dependent methyltransferase